MLSLLLTIHLWKHLISEKSVSEKYQHDLKTRDQDRKPVREMFIVVKAE